MAQFDLIEGQGVSFVKATLQDETIHAEHEMWHSGVFITDREVI